jgi:superoxide dismutase, Cu-Zn family
MAVDPWECIPAGGVLVKVQLRTLSLLSPLFALAACGSPPPPATAVDTSAPRVIVVPLQAKSGSHLSGTATFTEVPGGVKVVVEVAGAPPGQIATHVHETGDCSAPDAKSAGGHFNPAQKPHGLPNAPEHHLGDLGNIDVKPDGTGRTEVVVQGASLKDVEPTSYFGRAIIVHEKQDDGGQPVGNAGGRIGCGVIRPQ